jgi:exopolyphosphatase/guanosine-5'-triphosphate,3'-diphosphate pyrophosphatase
VISPPVVVGIIDIGSNTARLLVASVSGEGVGELHRDRRYLRLGDDVHALGRIGARKVKEAARVAKAFARTARKAGACEVETIVTAPGRQASNGVELVAALATSTRASVVQLSGDDEGRLAWHGAVARAPNLPETIAVVDLGGGSCELAVGGSEHGPTWVRSVDAGALRITREYLGSARPGPREVQRARDGIRRLVQELDPPAPDATLVVGGTARAIRRVIGSRFGSDQLEELATMLERVPVDSIVASYGVTHERAQTLLGGTLVLAELAYRLDSTLEVGQGGLREGAALSLARSVETAA